ncbi:MAG: FAD-dependent oxidoreductase [bacterium]|jgi:NAD(P)H-nitrite reductase large subunit
MKKEKRNKSHHYVIVGNSVAGIAAIEAIREHDRDRSILVIDREMREAYSRPLISYYLEGRVDEEQMRFRSKEYYRKMNVAVLMGTARTIKARERLLITEKNERIPYKKLLLAVGSEPVIPSIHGIDGPNVYTFTTRSDADALLKSVRKKQKAVVIGSGFIGIKAAEGLKSLGARVTMVEMADRPLPSMLDAEAGKIVAAHIRRSGVRLLLSSRVTEIKRKGSAVSAVKLTGGEEIPCSIVVVAVGVRPRFDLCRGTRIKTNVGIIVSSRMETSVENVYAAGDVTEAAVLAGGRKNIPIWPIAYEQGGVAGTNMAGGDTAYNGKVPMNSMEIFGLPLIAFGDTAADGVTTETIVMRSKTSNTYKKTFIQDDRIRGAIFLGEIERAGILSGLMLDEVDVSLFKEDLLKENFGYIYVPRQHRAKHISPLEV